MCLYFFTIFVLLVVFQLYFRFSYFGRLIHKIPGYTGLPIIGNALQTCGLDPATAFMFVRNMNRKYKSISKLWSFVIGMVNITEPDYVEKLLSTPRYTSKGMPYTFFRNWLGEGLLISNGEKWQHRRKLLTPAFHFTILKRFLETFNDQTEKLLARIQQRTEEQLDIVPIVCRTTLDVMCETSMGMSVNEGFEMIAKRYFNALHFHGNIIRQRLMTVWYHVDWIFNLSSDGSKEKKLMGDLHALTRKIIQERKVNNNNNATMKNEKRRLAMLDLLLENEKEGIIDMDGIREEVDTFLFEGHDTTAMALCFMIMRIANEPTIQDKIYKESYAIFGDAQRPPTMEDLSKMKYLECCIKESLRLYPSVPLIVRSLQEDVDLGKYVLPKGAIALIHIYDIHHNPELYPDPERFVPERFLPDNSVTRHPYSYIPFSAGSRNCIGQKFAMAEIKTVMSGLLRRFQLEAVTKPEDIVFLGDMVLRSSKPIYVKFKVRKEN